MAKPSLACSEIMAAEEANVKAAAFHDVLRKGTVGYSIGKDIKSSYRICQSTARNVFVEIRQSITEVISTPWQSTSRRIGQPHHRQVSSGKMNNVALKW